MQPYGGDFTVTKFLSVLITLFRARYMNLNKMFIILSEEDVKNMTGLPMPTKLKIYYFRGNTPQELI